MMSNYEEKKLTTDDLKDSMNDMNINANSKDETIVSFAGLLMKLDSEEDAMPIVRAINDCKQLLTLSLEGNTLGIIASKQIGKSLESKSSLKNVLFNNLFTGRLKTEIPDAILFLSSGIMLSNARLHTLDLSDNAIGPVGMPSLLPFLESQSCLTLETLRLNNNGLGVGGGQILAKGLKNLKNLKTFICGRNRLEIIGSKAIGNSLAQLTSLETLEMPQNGIHSEGIEAIAKAVEANPNLKNLNLNDNNLKTEAKTIAKALENVKAIESLNFGDCILKRSGCVAICEAINCLNVSNIKEIVLNGNEIGGEEAIQAIIKCSQRIIESRKQSTSPFKLELSNNNLGETAVQKLVQTIGQKIDLHISEDEGSDEEIEDENEDNEEEDEKEEDEKEEDHNETDKSLKDVSVNDIEELTKKIENDYTDINDLCTQFVKISIDGFDKNSSKINDEALIKSEIFLKSAIARNQNEYIAINTLLVSLGLLKNEDGKYERVEDLRGPLSALTHSIQHLSPQQKHVLRAFMNRPNKSVEVCGKIKHNLMQALFI